jgi:predicted DNA-binding transcriptional regulator AlpA
MSREVTQLEQTPGPTKKSKAEYLRQYRLDQYERVLPVELPLFVTDPLREEKLGWTDIVVCRLCGLKLEKLPQHLSTEHGDELSEGEAATTTHGLAMNYRKRFGFDKRAPLMSKALVDRFAQHQQTQNSRRKHKGKREVGFATRFRRGAKHKAHVSAATKARQEWGTSLQTKQKMSSSRLGVALPDKWKRDANGSAVTDWQIAKLRLKSKEHLQLSTDLTSPTIFARLQQMRFPPGKPCRFSRGEPVTEKRLRAHYEDMKELQYVRVLRRLGLDRDVDDQALTARELSALLKVNESWIWGRVNSDSKDQIPHSRSGNRLRFSLKDVVEWARGRHNGRSKLFSTLEIERELAKRLGTTPSRIYEFVIRPGGPQSRRDPTTNRRPNHPLPLSMADRLLASEVGLRQEFRRLGSTARGGRPRMLLPSEHNELPEKYKALVKDLDALLQWAELETEVVTLDRIGDWMCRQSRAGRIRVLLFWPSLHAQLPMMCEEVRNRVRGALGSAERTKEVLCKEYGISRAQLIRAITGQPVLAAA